MSRSASTSNHSPFDWNFSFKYWRRTTKRTSVSFSLLIFFFSFFFLSISFVSNQNALWLDEDTVDASDTLFYNSTCIRLVLPIRACCSQLAVTAVAHISNNGFETSIWNVIKSVSYLISFSTSSSTHFVFATVAHNQHSLSSLPAVSFFSFRFHGSCQLFIMFFSLSSSSFVCSTFVLFCRPVAYVGRIAQTSATKRRQIWQNWDLQTDILSYISMCFPSIISGDWFFTFQRSCIVLQSTPSTTNTMPHWHGSRHTKNVNRCVEWSENSNKTLTSTHTVRTKVTAWTNRSISRAAEAQIVVDAFAPPTYSVFSAHWFDPNKLLAIIK